MRVEYQEFNRLNIEDLNFQGRSGWKIIVLHKHQEEYVEWQNSYKIFYWGLMMREKNEAV